MQLLDIGKGAVGILRGLARNAVRAWTLARSWEGARGLMVSSATLILILVLSGMALNLRPVSRAQPRPTISPVVQPSPSPSTETASAGPVGETGFAGNGSSWDCSRVPSPPRLSAPEFPRVVIPAVGINLLVRQGDGGTPPEGQWVAWFYPGLNQPGVAGNTYIYAHAHGYPVGSATGLFWPLHYMHRCEAIYLYTGPATAYRYVVTVVDLHHSGYDDAVLSQTADERLTLQTCNDWAPHGPKTIIVARRYVDPAPTPSPSAAPPARNAPPAGSAGGDPAPASSPAPTDSGGGGLKKLLPSPG